MRAARVLVGNRRLLAEHGIALDAEAEAGARARSTSGARRRLLVAVDGRVAGLIGVRDAVRPEAHDVVHDLKHLKITRDRPPDRRPRAAAARVVAKKVHIKTVEAELLPADKAALDRGAAGGRAAGGDGRRRHQRRPGAGAGRRRDRPRGHRGRPRGRGGRPDPPGRPAPQSCPTWSSCPGPRCAVIRQNIIVFAFGLNALAMVLAALGHPRPGRRGDPAPGRARCSSCSTRCGCSSSATGPSCRPSAGCASSGSRDRRELDEPLDLGAGLAMAASASAGGSLRGGASALLRARLRHERLAAIGPGEVGLVQRFGGYRATPRAGPPPPRCRPRSSGSTRVEPDASGAWRSGSAGDGRRPGEPLRWEAATAARSAWRTEDDDALLLTGDGQFLEIIGDAPVRPRRRPAATPCDGSPWASTAPRRALRPLAEAAVREVVAPAAAARPADRRAAGEAERGHRAAPGAAANASASASASTRSPSRTSIRRWRSSTPTATSRGPRATASAGSTRRRPTAAEKLAEAEAKAAAIVAAAEAGRERQVARPRARPTPSATGSPPASSAPALTDSASTGRRSPRSSPAGPS